VTQGARRPHPEGRYGITKMLAAGLVHLYTATGVVLGFFALVAIDGARFQLAFLYLGVATIVDYTDGTIARHMETRRILPFVNARKLDAIVDFETNALVPAFLLWKAELLPVPKILSALLILLFAAYRYSRTYDPRTADGLFRGLPVLWVFYAFYVYFLQVKGASSLVIIVVMVLLGLSQVSYIHVARFQRWRLLNATALTAWWLVYFLYSLGLASGRRLAVLSLCYPLFYLVTSWIAHLTKKSRG